MISVHQRGLGDNEVTIRDGLLYVYLAGPQTAERAELTLAAFREHYTALAAMGTSRLAEVALYLMQAGGAKHRAKYFASEAKARAWLEAQQRPQSERSTIISTKTPGFIPGVLVYG